jgi:hypothetical protein
VEPLIGRIQTTNIWIRPIRGCDVQFQRQLHNFIIDIWSVILAMTPIGCRVVRCCQAVATHVPAIGSLARLNAQILLPTRAKENAFTRIIKVWLLLRFLTNSAYITSIYTERYVKSVYVLYLHIPLLVETLRLYIIYN